MKNTLWPYEWVLLFKIHMLHQTNLSSLTCVEMKSVPCSAEVDAVCYQKLSNHRGHCKHVVESSETNIICILCFWMVILGQNWTSQPALRHLGCKSSKNHPKHIEKDTYLESQGSLGEHIGASRGLLETSWYTLRAIWASPGCLWAWFC